MRGQSFFEAVLALMIIALVAITVASLAAVSIRNNIFSRNKTQANQYAREATEWLRQQRDVDWTVFQGRAGTWCLNALTLNWNNNGLCNSNEVITNTIFIREAVLTSTPDQITANVTVKWTDAKGTHEVKASTIFTKW